MTQLKSFSLVSRLSILYLLLACLFVQPVVAQEGQAIGRVLSTTGSVTARDLNGALRTLERRSDIFVGDTVITGPNGFAQLRMVDSARISFKEDTEFTFSEYSSDGPGGAADSALMEMVRGGFRTISGTIGDDDVDEYQISTQFASIGIRGTTHEAVIDAGVLLTGVYDGGTTVSNALGSLDTGEGANFDYSSTFPGQAPQGLLQQPQQLGRINLNAGLNGAGDNDGNDDAEDDDGGNDNGGGNDDGDNADDGGDVAPPGGQQNNAGNGLAANGNANLDPTLDNNRNVESEINPLMSVRSPEDFSRTGTGSVAQDDTGSNGGGGDNGSGGGTEDDSTPVLSPADNLRISDRVGFILSRIAAPGSIFPGNVTDLAPGQSVILAGNDLNSPFTLDAEPPYIFRGAGSFLGLTDGTVTAQGENPYVFDIGIWGSTQNPVTLYSDFTDDSIFQQITSPLLVVSVDPAPIASLTGSVVYLTNFNRILGGSSLGGGITDFFTSFNVDFAAALITDGDMEFCIGGGASCTGENAQKWNFDFTGNVVNGFVVAHPVNNTGYINHQQASIFGTIAGVFTGNNAEAFVGGFNLYYDADLDIFRSTVSAQSLNIPDTTVDGVFLVERDNRLDADDIDHKLDNDGFLVQEAYARILLGYTRPTTDDPILFVDQRSRPRLVLTDPDSNIEISDRNQNLSDVISAVYRLDWERWDGTLLGQTDNLDISAVENAIDDVAFFSTFKVSRMEDITGHYNRLLGYIGENDTGDEITNIEMSFDINFSSSINNIENGSLEIYLDYPEQEWVVFFEGSLNKNIVEFDFLDMNPDESESRTFPGLYVYNSDTYNYDVFDIDFDDSNMQGAIIDDGRNTPALLSSFYFREDSEGPGRSVAGQALVARTDPRFDLLFANDEQITNRALVNIPYLKDMDIIYQREAFLDGSLGINERAFGLSSEELNSNNTDVFFMGLENNSYWSNYYNEDFSDYFSWCECDEVDYFTADFRQTTGEHVEFSHFDEETFLLSEHSFDLDMGKWAGAVGLFELGIFENYGYEPDEDDYRLSACSSSNFGCFGLDQEGFESPAFWVNYSSFYFNPYGYTGRFSTLLESFGEFRLTNSSGALVLASPVKQFSVDLLIDFYGPYITGTLTAISDTASLASPLTWTASLSNGYMDDVFYGGSTVFTINAADGTLSSSASSDLILDFGGAEDMPILLGSYQSSQDLSNGGTLDVAGIFAARETRVAVVVESFQSLSDTGSVLFGSASRPLGTYAEGSSDTVSPHIGLNLDVNGGQNIAGIDLGHAFDLVLTGDSTVYDVTPDMYDSNPIAINIDSGYGYVDWGFWDSSDMRIIHNEANIGPGANDDVFWATVTPINPAVLQGSVSYASDMYNPDVIGKGNLIAGGENIITHFSMDFNVDFDAPNGVGAITDGDFYAKVGGVDAWIMTFEGNVNGAFAEMNNFNGSFNGSPILGEMNAVFTGTYSDLYGSGAVTGFSLYNALGDHLNGIGYLDCQSCGGI